MRKIKVLLMLMLCCTATLFAQNQINIFIGGANKCASVDLPVYQRRLCKEYRITRDKLNYYYNQCGRKWGDVCLLLEMARCTGKHMKDACNIYARYHRHGWNQVMIEIGIRPGSKYYKDFYDRMEEYEDYWEEYYEEYKKNSHKCRKHHNKHRHHGYYYDDDEEDNDNDDDDD